MWLLILGFLFAYPIIEVLDGWLLRRSTREHLAKLREHAISGHRWDVTRGQWTA